MCGSELSRVQEKQLGEVIKEFEDVLSDSPGLAEGAKFSIDTYDTQPIAQAPYNTPMALRDHSHGAEG